MHQPPKHPTDQDTFVATAPTWRLLLLLPIVAFSAGVLFVIAAVLPLADPGTHPASLAIWLLALVLFAVGLFMVLLGLSLFSRIEVGKERLKLRVPLWRGAMPWIPWVRGEIPFSDIRAVERRDEIYSSFGIPSMQTAYSIANAEGRRIVLGYRSPLAAWNYPLDEAAVLIADKAGVKLVDRGGVKIGGIVRSAIQGPPSWDTPSVSEEERQATQAKAARALGLVFAFMAAVVALRACLQSQ